MIVETEEKCNDNSDVIWDDTLVDPDQTDANDATIFSEEFEREIVKNIIDHRDLADHCRTVMPAKMFGSVAHKTIAAIVYDYTEKYKEAMPFTLLQLEFEQKIAKHKPEYQIALRSQLNALQYVATTAATKEFFKDRVTSTVQRVTIVNAARTYHEDGDLKAFSETTAKAMSLTAAEEYELFDVFDLDNLPEMVWQVENHIPLNGTVTIFGPSGHRKSFYAMEMAFSIAAGQPFLGKYPVVAGNVLYIYSEGFHGLKQRVDAWHSSTAVAKHRNIVFSNIGHAIPNLAAVDVLIERATARLGKIDHVVIDTLSRNFDGGDTDNNRDMQRYLRGVDRIRELTGATVVSVHHTGNNETERERGAKSLRDYSDTSICIQSEGDVVNVSCKKQKDAKEFEAYCCNAVEVGRSLVLKFGETKTDAKKLAVDEKLISLLPHIPAVPLADALTDGNTTTMAKLRSSTGLSNSELDRRVQQLLTDGTISKNADQKPFRYYRFAEL